MRVGHVYYSCSLATFLSLIQLDRVLHYSTDVFKQLEARATERSVVCCGQSVSDCEFPGSAATVDEFH